MLQLNQWEAKRLASAEAEFDIWEPEEDIYWGPEEEMLGNNRYVGERV